MESVKDKDRNVERVAESAILLNVLESLKPVDEVCRRDRDV